MISICYYVTIIIYTCVIIFSPDLISDVNTSIAIAEAVSIILTEVSKCLLTNAVQRIFVYLWLTMKLDT